MTRRLFNRVEEAYHDGQRVASLDLETFGRSVHINEWQVFKAIPISKLDIRYRINLSRRLLIPEPRGFLEKAAYYFGKYREFHPPVQLFDL